MNQARKPFFYLQWVPRPSGIPSRKKTAVLRLMLLSLIIFISLSLTFPVSAGPQSSTYELKEFGFGAGGVASASSTTYSLFGIAGEQDLASTSATSYSLQGGLTFTMQTGVPPAPTVSNPGNNYDRLKIIVATGGNPTDTQYAIAISDDNWATTKFVKSDYTVGSTLINADWLLYSGGQGIGWGGATGFYVTGLKNSTTYQVRVKAKQGAFTESQWSNGAAQTTSDPTLTFAINSEIGGQVGHWNLDQNGTTATDSSGIGNDLTWVGSRNDHWAGGKWGSSANIAAATDYLNISNPTSLRISAGQLTVAAWVKVNTFGAWRTILAKTTQGANQMEYWFGFNTGNQLEFALNPGTSDDTDRFYVGSTPTISDSNWHHVAATYDGTSVALYIDGVLANTPEIHTGSMYSGTGDFTVGYTKEWSVSLGSGNIDEVRVYNTALSGKQVTTLYQAAPNLSSNLYFNNLNAGNSYTDSSKTTHLITSTNAYNGYIIYAHATGPLANVVDASKTISDYAGTNSSPTAWSGNGFGYTTNDAVLTGGTANRFTNNGPNYAGFTTTIPGDPVADHDGPVVDPITDEQFTVSYRVTAPSNTVAGTYQTQVEYIITPTY